jgi:Transglutaminase-like superfamily
LARGNFSARHLAPPILSELTMGYALPANLSFCVTGGRVIFLDLAHDRYFRLGAGLDAAFQALLKSGHGSDQDIGALVRLGVIRRADGGEGLSQASVTVASRSALETEAQGPPPGAWMTLQVGLSVTRTWLLLKRTPIVRVLDQLRRTRARVPARCRTAQMPVQSDDVLALAAQFYQARRIVPIDTVCLLDSLALVNFLGRRGLFACLVMGVKLNPFAGHCWVQLDDIILNDAFDRASAFTPILVVG